MRTCKKRRLRLESLEQRQLLAAHPFETDVQLLQRNHTNDNWYLGGTREYLSDENPSQDWTPMVSGDFTADGMTDVLGTVAGEWWLQVNDGTQLFGVPWGESPLNETELIGTGDFNNDGWLDVMSRDVATGNFLLSKNSADGFTVEQWGGWTTAVQWSNITIRDFDNDGLLDVLGSEPGGNWWLAKNNGTRSYNHHWGKYQLFDWQDIVEGDFNGDQFGDMASRGPDNTWRVWFGTDSGFQVPEYRGHWKVRNEWHDVMAADFDGDGRDDLIGRSDDGLLWVATSLEDRFQTRKWATGWIESAEWANVKLVDVDDDGMIDQIGQANDGTFWVAKNDGQKMRNHFWGRAEGTPEFVDYVGDFESTTALDVAAFFPGDFTPPVQELPATRDSDLHVSLSADNRLVVTATNGPVEAIGIDIHSASGSLIPIPGGDSAVADPFQYILANSVRNVAIGTVGDVVMFEGSTTLNVGWNPNSGERDLWVRYGNLVLDSPPIRAWVDPSLSGIDEEAVFVAQSVDYAELNRRNYQRIVSSLVVPKHETTALDVAAFSPDEVVPLRPADPTTPTPSPVATASGELYVSLSADNRLVVTAPDGPVSAIGIDIHSASGSLIPIPGGDSAVADPFEFILANSVRNVALGSIGEAVVFEGSTTLNVGWNPDSGERDLWVQYGGLTPDSAPIQVGVDPSLSGSD